MSAAEILYAAVTQRWHDEKAYRATVGQGDPEWDVDEEVVAINEERAELAKPSKPKGHRVTKEETAALERFNAVMSGRNSVTVGEMLDAVGLTADVPDGRVELTVEKITAQGGRIRLHVKDAKGGKCEVPIGRLTDRRTLNRNLRVLIGATDIEDIHALRAALEGKRIYVKLGSRDYKGHPYRTLARA